MRQFLLVIVLALFANAYDAAAHMFGATLVSSAQEMSDMDCCPPAKESKTKAMIIACHYCCTGVLAAVYPFHLRERSVDEIYDSSTLPGFNNASLENPFRPPRPS
jgi:hypothetical protein